MPSTFIRYTSCLPTGTGLFLLILFPVHRTRLLSLGENTHTCLRLTGQPVLTQISLWAEGLPAATPTPEPVPSLLQAPRMAGYQPQPPGDPAPLRSPPEDDSHTDAHSDPLSAGGTPLSPTTPSSPPFPLIPPT